MDSILLDIKHRIGPSAEFDYYDVDIIDAINTAFSILTQLGAGPEGGFEVMDDSQTWDDFVSDTTVKGLVRTYVYNKVRLIFDPPNSGSVASAMDEQNKEYEQRISYWVDDQRGGLT